MAGGGVLLCSLITELLDNELTDADGWVLGTNCCDFVSGGVGGIPDEGPRFVAGDGTRFSEFGDGCLEFS